MTPGSKCGVIAAKLHCCIYNAGGTPCMTMFIDELLFCKGHHVSQQKKPVLSFTNTVLIMVYDLWTQILSSVAPIPEQIGTTIMHFSEVSGGTY